MNRMNRANEGNEKERQRYRAMLSTDLIRIKALLQKHLLSLPNGSRGLTNEEIKNLLTLKEGVNVVISRFGLNYEELKKIDYDKERI